MLPHWFLPFVIVLIHSDLSPFPFVFSCWGLMGDRKIVSLLYSVSATLYCSLLRVYSWGTKGTSEDDIPLVRTAVLEWNVWRQRRELAEVLRNHSHGPLPFRVWCEQLSISTPSIFLGVIPCLPGVFLTLRDSDTHSKLPLLYFLLHTSLPLFYLEGDVCTECRGSFSVQ